GMQAKAVKEDERDKPLRNLKTLEQEIQKIITENRLQEIAEVTFHAAGVAVEFKDHDLLASASARLNPEHEKLVSQVLHAITSMPSRYRLEVEGHTDDLPIRTRRFRDNWDLSSSRAISLVRRFRAEGVAPTRLSAMAYADTRPKVPLQGKKGKTLQ